MKHILYLFLLLCSSLSFAEGFGDDWSTAVGCRVYHADRTKKYNESHNNCVSLQHGEYFAMTFQNSIWRRSAGVGYMHVSPVSENLSIGYSATVLSGYNSTGIPVVFPFVTASYSLRNFGSWGRHIAIDFSTNYIVSQVQLRYKFDSKVHSTTSGESTSPWAVDYSYGTDGGRISLLRQTSQEGVLPSGAYVSGVLTLGSSVHERYAWTNLPNTQRVSEKGILLLLNWFPMNNRWLGVYAGAGITEVRYSSSYALNSSLSADAAAHHLDSYKVSDLGGLSLPIHTKVSEEVRWGKSVQPVIGLRIGNPFGSDTPVKVYLDIGARKLAPSQKNLVMEFPGASSSEQLLLGDAIARAFLNGKNTESWMKKRWLPSIQIGVNYRF